MENLIKQALDEYFFDFKKYHLLILILFTIIIALLQVLQSIFISKKIENFKSELKKSEIKFSKYNQIQIEALSNAYELLTDFLKITYITKRNLNHSSPELISSTAKDWLTSYGKTYSYFSHKKYIFPISIKNVFSDIVKELNTASEYIKSKKDISEMFHTWENGEVELMGDEIELEQLYKKLENFDKNGIIDKTIENINKIRKEIEMYFEKIE